MKHSNDSNETYWQDILKNRRMSIKDEAYRLSHVLYGHLYNHNRYAEISGRNDFMDVFDFWDSKRPYGNKDIEASIVFQLGWDHERRLTENRLPEFVRDEARKLHVLVKEELAEHEDFLISIKNEKTN